MALPFYAVEAHTGNIISLDDESVVKDQASLAGAGGNTYAPYLVSTIFDEGGDGGYSRFRRAVQHVHTSGAVTVDVTPYGDEMEAGSSIQRVMATGANPIITAQLSTPGTNFQVKVALSAFDAAAELGKAQQYIVPRRSQR